MRSSSLESKTIRPGMYSFYHSDRRPQSVATRQVVSKPKKKHGKLIITLAILVLAFGVFKVQGNSSSTPKSSQSSAASKAAPAAIMPANSNNQLASKDNPCTDNSLDKMVLISISSRRAWACEKNKQVKESPIISGMESVESTKTPVGTFKIYAKAKDTVLSGTDPTTGQWREPVSYWMPYHDNQYGTYGFHDAPWRQPGEFGNIDPNSMNGSHGCVQLPTAMAKWVYDWAPIGTTVVVKS